MLYKKILFVALLFILSMNASFAKPPKVLVFGKTTSFYHESIPDGMVAIQLLGKETGFDVDTTRDAAVFTDNNLKQYAAIVFVSTADASSTLLTDAQREAFVRFIQSGKGYVGIHAAADAELLTSYFQAVGGVPASNVRLLQDWKALRPDIDETLMDWLPGHMNKDAVVIVYFAGLATVAPNGEVFLVPYDGSVATSSRSLPLKDLEAALTRLKAKQTLFVFDGMVARLGTGSDSRPKAVLPQWNPSGSSTVHLIATNGVGRVVEDEDHRHGLFTYYLLRALRGESDVNRDGEVTLGEAAAYLNQKVLWASKTQYGQEQRPAVVPPLKATDPASAIALAKLASVRASENP